LYQHPTSDSEEIYKRGEQDDIFRFLANLDSTHESFYSQILLLPALSSIDDVMGRVKGEETMRDVIDSQPISDLEVKVIAATKPYSNPRLDVQGNQTNWCEFCKKEV
jgi:hypothetical protein